MNKKVIIESLNAMERRFSSIARTGDEHSLDCQQDYIDGYIRCLRDMGYEIDGTSGYMSPFIGWVKTYTNIKRVK